jgi:hypothetical protein
MVFIKMMPVVVGRHAVKLIRIDAMFLFRLVYRTLNEARISYLLTLM